MKKKLVKRRWMVGYWVISMLVQGVWQYHNESMTGLMYSLFCNRFSHQFNFFFPKRTTLLRLTRTLFLLTPNHAYLFNHEDEDPSFFKSKKKEEKKKKKTTIPKIYLVCLPTNKIYLVLLASSGIHFSFFGYRLTYP